MSFLRKNVRIFAVAIAFLMSIQVVQAKGFGVEVDETTRPYGLGQCMTTRVTKLKVFWITIYKSNPEYEITKC